MVANPPRKEVSCRKVSRPVIVPSTPIATLVDVDPGLTAKMVCDSATAMEGKLLRRRRHVNCVRGAFGGQILMDCHCSVLPVAHREDHRRSAARKVAAGKD